MVASGMDMRGARPSESPKQIRISGKIKSPVTSSATTSNVYNWPKWDGIASQFGNVNLNPETECRPLSPLSIHSIIYSYAITPKGMHPFKNIMRWLPINAKPMKMLNNRLFNGEMVQIKADWLKNVNYRQQRFEVKKKLYKFAALYQ